MAPARLLLLFVIMTGVGSRVQQEQQVQEVPARPAEKRPDLPPTFANLSRRRVIGQVGSPAYLSCQVLNLGDRAVSWVRMSDLKILTVGTFTYTSDHRFSAVHAEGSEEWLLKITSAVKADSGVYECQVSAEPKLSQPFQLDVVESKAVLSGPRELFLKRGSSINLTCTVLAAPEPPEHIHWYINNMVIRYTERGGIYVETNRRARTSTLLVSAATGGDSGNYSCRPARARTDTVVVHILDGEHPAAMQHGNSNMSGDVTLVRTLMVLLLGALR